MGRGGGRGGGEKKDKDETSSQDKMLIIGMQLFTIAIAIVGIVMASITHASFNAAVNDFQSIIKNWETPPPVAMYFVAEGTQCDEGDNAIKLPDWPGTNSSACACPISALTSGVSSSSDKWCSKKQVNAGCWDQEKIRKESLSWYGGKWCYDRTGSHAQYDPKKGSSRPLPACPSGYQQCGTGTYDETGTICFPEEEKCPYTGIDGTSGAVPSSPYHSNRAMNMSGHRVFLVREGVRELPFNEFEFSFHDGNRMGICYRPEDRKNTNQEKYRGKGSSNKYKNEYNSKCKKVGNTFVDTRYEELDSMSETAFLMQNFLNHPWCTDCSSCDDYIATNIKCDDNPFSNSDCLQYINNPSKMSSAAAAFTLDGCDSADRHCKEIMFQSKCGALKRWANGAKYDVGIFGRREISWDTTCDVALADMANMKDRVTKVAAALLAVFVMSIIINSLTGIIMPYVVIRNANGYDWPCIPGKGEIERKLIKRYNQFVGFTLKAGKAIPSFIAIAVIESTRYYFRKAAEGACSDPLTNKTVKALSEMLPEARSNLISVIVIDCILLVVATVEMAREWMKSKREGVAPEQKDDEEGGAGIATATLQPPTVNAEVELVPEPHEQPQQPAVFVVEAEMSM